ncbi:MAG: ABC transporter permease [Clostridia bacterium]|nr:ABC transporter permease [Clostridia bacterium]
MLVTLLSRAIRIAAAFLYGSTGETIIEKSGHLNLGIPGIMCFGAVGGCIGADMAQKGGAGAFGIIVATIFFAMLFAGAMGLLYGFFTISLRCNQNVTGLTITTFGAGVLGFWRKNLLNIVVSDEGTITFKAASDFIKAPMFGAVGDDWFSKIFLSHGTLVYLAIIIAIVVAIVLKKTRTGLSLNAIGENPAAADAAGIKVIKYKYISCVLGAAIAGIGGAFCLLDLQSGSTEYPIEAIGWLAVALVIFSLWRPGIGILGSFVFGLLYVMPNYINGIGTEYKKILEIIPYAVTALVLIVISFFNKRETQPPTALGVPYFREDR